MSLCCMYEVCLYVCLHVCIDKGKYNWLLNNKQPIPRRRTNWAGGNASNGGAAIVSGEEHQALGPRFFSDVRLLFDRLDSSAALGRVSEAAVRTPLPTLEDVRNLLEVQYIVFPIIFSSVFLFNPFRLVWFPFFVFPPQFPPPPVKSGYTGLDVYSPEGQEIDTVVCCT